MLCDIRQQQHPGENTVKGTANCMFQETCMHDQVLQWQTNQNGASIVSGRQGFGSVVLYLCLQHI